MEDGRPLERLAARAAERGPSQADGDRETGADDSLNRRQDPRVDERRRVLRPQMAVSALETYAVTVFLVIALGTFARKLTLRVRYLFAGQGAVRRWDHIPTRVKNFIVYGIFQRKVAREWYAGVLHSFIFWAFVILGASVVEITAQAYAPGWRVPSPKEAGVSLPGPRGLAAEGLAVLPAVGGGRALCPPFVRPAKKINHAGT